VAAIAIACAAASLLAQGQSPQTPTFGVRSTYIEVDAVVTDQHGRAIRDLTREDFVVLEDGTPQKIDAFSFIDIANARTAPTVEASTAPNAAGTAAAPPTGGRVFLIVLDTLHVAAARTPMLRRRAREFVEQHLEPRDHVAIAHIAYPQFNLDFTTDHARVLKSIASVIGEQTESATVARANADAALAVMGVRTDRSAGVRRRLATDTVFALQQLSEAFAAVPVHRKMLVFFSEGLDIDMSQDVDLLDEVRRVFAAAARANVTIYTVDPRGVATIGDELLQIRGNDSRGELNFGARQLWAELRTAQHSLRTFAEETGGVAAVGSNDFTRAFNRIVADASTYYLLGYRPTNSATDGTFRSVQVRVSRSGAQVRARKGYYAK
jgi:VWFA-related protein